MRYDQKYILVFAESTVYCCPILIELEFSQPFSKNSQMSNLMKVSPVGAELFHADRLTDRRIDVTKLIAAFRNFANAFNK